MPRACGRGVGIGEGAGPNQRSLCVQLRNLDLVLGETAPPESFQRGKGMCFQNIVLLAEWSMDWRKQNIEVSVCILPSFLLACEFLKSRIIFFVCFHLYAPVKLRIVFNTEQLLKRPHHPPYLPG